jgi:hypothetical protein
VLGVARKAKTDCATESRNFQKKLALNQKLDIMLSIVTRVTWPNKTQKERVMKKTTAISLMTYVLTLLCMNSAQAILIDFDVASGYTAGQKLYGQPPSGTKWGGTNNDTWMVSTNGGVNNSQAMQVNSNNTNTYVSANFVPAATDTPDIDIANASGIVKFEFYFKNNDYSSSGSGAIRLELFRSSLWVARINSINQKGQATFLSINEAGDNITVSGLFADTDWHKVTFLCNYDKLTYKTLVDDVLIADNYKFYDNDGTSKSLGFFGFKTEGTTNGAKFTIDNILIEAVPQGTILMVN